MRPGKYIERNGYLVRVWSIRYSYRGFQYRILVEGTEPEMYDYMQSEMGYVGSYYALDEQDVRMAKELGMKIYLAPQL